MLGCRENAASAKYAAAGKYTAARVRRLRRGFSENTLLLLRDFCSGFFFFLFLFAAV